MQLYNSTAAQSIGGGRITACSRLLSSPGLVFKVAKKLSQVQDIRQEFEYMDRLSRLRTSQPQLFKIPLPLAFEHGHCRIESAGLEDNARRLSIRDLQVDFKALGASLYARYAMERIASLPDSLSAALLKEYATHHANEAIVLCQLYFGKKEPMKRRLFVDSRNFPLDVTSYERLASSTQCRLPHVAIVSHEMGRMLASVQVAGFDGRGIKFVLAGSSGRQDDMQEQQEVLRSHGHAAEEKAPWSFHVYHFSRMSALSGCVGADAQLLATAFFLNDLYFPRPRPRAKLYEQFKAGWYRMLSWGHHVHVADLFFDMIEAIQARRDTGIST